MSGDWTIGDMYFYQAGPLPGEREEKAKLAQTKCPCKTHPKYQAKRKPRGACEACWRFYIERHP